VPLSSARTRLIVPRVAFAAPSLDGKASIRLSEPERHSGGATTASTPSTFRSVATIGARSAPSSTSTTNGFITPAEMPASASAVRPWIALPVPGKSFACASLGFSWTP